MLSKDIAATAFGALSTVLGLACLYAGFQVWTTSNWRPAEMPFPPVGIEVATLFHVASGGRFWFQVETPDRDDNALVMSQRADIPCRIQVVITGPGDVTTTTQLVERFQHGGRYYFGNIDYYHAGAPFPLARGDYTLRVRTEVDPDLFRAQGAILSLERVAEPSGWVTLGALSRGSGFVFVLAGLAIFVAHGLFRGRPRSVRGG